MAFQETDAALFFGRNDDIYKGLEQLRRLRRSGNERLLLYLGSSGSGKSSLVRAGVLPRIKQDSDNWIVTSPFRPSEGLGNPVENLSAVLSEAFSRYGISHSETDITQQLTTLPSPTNISSTQSNSPHSLLKIARELSVVAKHREATVLIIIDQFEELLGGAPSDPGQSFLTWLGEALIAAQSLPSCPVLILATMRSDFVSDFQQCAGLQTVDTEQFLVNPIPIENFGELIEGPAQLAGLTLQPGLVTKIIQDAKTENALPLLAFTLSELWQRHGSDGDLTLAEYDELGGLTGAVKMRSKEVFNAAKLDTQREEALRMAFLNMVQIRADSLGELSPYTRKQVQRSELSQSVLPILKEFVDARLVVEKETGTYEVAHESLFQVWPQLKEWLENNYAFLLWRRQMEEATATWEQNNHDDDLLLRGRFLAEAEGWLQEYPANLDEMQQRYIRQSLTQRDRVAKRKIWLYQGIAAGAIAILAVVSGFWLKAQEQEILALSQASEAEFIVNKGTTIDALKSSLEAGLKFQQLARISNREKAKPMVMKALTQAMYWVQEKNRLEGHESFVDSAVYSPDGKKLATAGYDNTIKLWDKEGKEIWSGEHDQAIISLAFSPDGQQIASGDLSGTLKIWDLEGTIVSSQPTFEPSKVTEEETTQYAIEDIAFSPVVHPDGSHIITVGIDGLIKFWDLNGEPIRSIQTGAGQELISVAISPDGSTLATAGYDGESNQGNVKLWNIQQKPDGSYENRPQMLTTRKGLILDIQFSPDKNSSLVAIANDQGTVQLWDTQTKASRDLPKTLGSTKGFSSVAFSPDGQKVAAASLENTLQLWSITGKPIDTIEGHIERINSVTFSPDGELLASASNDLTVRLWQVNRPWLKVFNQHQSAVYSVIAGNQFIASAGIGNTIQRLSANGESLPAWSTEADIDLYDIAMNPKANVVAAASSSGKILFWTLEGQPLPPLLAHSEATTGVAFNDDGTLMATVSTDDTAKLWQRNDDARFTLKKTLDSHTNDVMGVSFQPGGNKIATASDDATIVLWDLNGEKLKELKGYTKGILKVRFSPDGNALASAGRDGQIRIWDADGNLVRQLNEHNSVVTDIRWSSDGKLLASASDDKTLKLWTQDGQLITTFSGHADAVNTVTFSTDDRFLISGSSDGQVIWWDLTGTDLESLVQQGCTLLGDWSQISSRSLQKACR